jgi:hypothetical protein
MKVKRRKFNIFEKMELEFQKNSTTGPIEEYILTPKEFKEFSLDAKNRPHVSFTKVTGRPEDKIGGDWKYRGALITVDGKIIEN